jgi:hypothetical protein
MVFQPSQNQREIDMKRPTHLDVCSGIGGFTIAAHWAGFQTVGFAEVEPYCCALLERHWPGVPNYGDLRRADFSGLRGSVTVLSDSIIDISYRSHRLKALGNACVPQQVYPFFEAIAEVFYSER